MAEPPISREVLQTLGDQPEALIDIILRQGERILAQRQLIGQQQEAIRRLAKQVAGLEEQLGQGGPGGAAPFRVRQDKRSRAPKKPGRRQGHQGRWRATPGQVDQTIEVALERCPHCGAEPEDVRDIVQHLIELPPIKPLVIKLRTQRGWCPHCRQACASGHPLQVSQATGAAGTHLGPGSLAAAAELRYAAGLTMRTTCAVMESLLGLRLTPGGLSQAMDRAADRNCDHYHDLERIIRGSQVLHTDETGWWLENRRASLWVMCQPQATLYRIVDHKDRATFHETIPPDWPGVLVSDCLAVYDDATGLQHKCYAHHLKAISQARERLQIPSPWLDQVRLLLTAAIALDKERDALEPAKFAETKRALHLAAHALLTEDLRPCPHEEAVRNRLWKQRDHLLVFLDHPGVDATNNLAERQLRPAVIRRKLSCGNKTRRGARSFEILASLAATFRQTGQSFLGNIAAAMHLQQV